MDLVIGAPTLNGASGASQAVLLSSEAVIRVGGQAGAGSIFVSTFPVSRMGLTYTCNAALNRFYLADSAMMRW